MFDVSIFGIHFRHKPPQTVKLKKGESVIVSFWRWFPPGYKRKLINITDKGIDVSEI